MLMLYLEQARDLHGPCGRRKLLVTPAVKFLVWESTTRKDVISELTI